MHAAEVADTLGMKTVIVPRHAGIFSAVGLARADIRRDAVETYLRTLAEVDCDELHTRLDDLHHRLRQQLKSTRIPVLRTRVCYFAEMRCIGQSHELLVSLGDNSRSLSRSGIESAFQTVYERRYGRAPARRIEIVQIRALVEATVDSSRTEAWQRSESTVGRPPARLVRLYAPGSLGEERFVA